MFLSLPFCYIQHQAYDGKVPLAEHGNMVNILNQHAETHTHTPSRAHR